MTWEALYSWKTPSTSSWPVGTAATSSSMMYQRIRPPAAAHRLFLARYDSSGVLGEFHAARDQGARGIRGIGQDGGGNMYVAGYYQDSLSFPGLPVMGFDQFQHQGDVPCPQRRLQYGPGYPRDRDHTAYPNPTGGSFTVQSENPFTELRIVSTLGALVAHDRFAPSTLRQLELQAEGALPIPFGTRVSWSGMEGWWCSGERGFAGPRSLDLRRLLSPRQTAKSARVPSEVVEA